MVLAQDVRGANCKLVIVGTYKKKKKKNVCEEGLSVRKPNFLLVVTTCIREEEDTHLNLVQQ